MVCIQNDHVTTRHPLHIYSMHMVSNFDKKAKKYSSIKYQTGILPEASFRACNRIYSAEAKGTTLIRQRLNIQFCGNNLNAIIAT